MIDWMRRFQLVAMTEQLVELNLAQHRTQRGLRELRGLIDVVDHLDGRVVGVDT